MTRPIVVEMSAVLVTLDRSSDGLTKAYVNVTEGPDLPNSAFDPDQHRTLERALRDWVARDTGFNLGYAEQLYTFGDGARGQHLAPNEPHTVSIGYLAIVPGVAGAAINADWLPWTRFFPWEDQRMGPAEMIASDITPRLRDWAGSDPDRQERARLSFGLEGAPWRDELALERYELLYSARLLEEAHLDRKWELPADLPALGQPMPLDHRRILATGIGRLRAKLKYRPVLFELMPRTFTLFELQAAAEAVSGQTLHKQNFRRMVLKSGLVEPTGAMSVRNSGRPAAEYRFASEAEWEKRVSPVRFGGARQGRD